jgi:DNA polymerase-3 subunit gamma/tau
MATFYQKYRPNNFAEVVNQNHIKITLQNELEKNQTAHAYLFCGPRGTGKTTVARVFAKALNCENRKTGESEPCGACLSCEQIKQGISLDIIEIDAASHTGVDNVRENIIAGARISITPGKFRVFIIDEVHMLSISAFNALLKTLEEPPARVVFILCTTEAHKLPATIISRCQRFDFKRISTVDIAQKLNYIASKEGVMVETGILETIARHSEGHMRDAEGLLNQVFSISNGKVTQEKADLVIPRSNLNLIVDLINFIAKKDTAQAVRLINQLIDDGVDLKQFNADLIEILRRMMLGKISQPLAEKYAQDLGPGLEERLRPLAAELSVGRIVEVINIFTQAQTDLKNSFIVQLPLEIAAIKLCAAGVPETAFAPALSARPNKVPAAANSTSGNQPATVMPIKFAELQEKWNELLLHIKKYNHSLSFILKVCEPRENNGALCLVFKYKFHKERIEQPAIKQILAQAMQEVFGNPINFSALLDENLVIANGNGAEEISSAVETGPLTEQPENDKKEISADTGIDTILNMFGGKVVN